MSESTQGRSPSPESADMPEKAAETTQYTRKGLVRDVLLFTLARIVLAGALTAVIIGIGLLFGIEVYFLVALLFAVIIAMPLSIVLFRPLRFRITSGIAAIDEQRRRDRAELEAKLRSGRSRGER
ncbi:DUF4229 domain-containing protein [Hoyosella sp. YIM 151337]|uniref:DUF4229 domain-containing protein n=1 Tax=Hoyosella sp. YIM 151337 TaxID=2992742 RepID=UPI002235F010|nr:DUF4229 domain-containing protein [Hoyosella sp. YIM 151337]MCW4352816.1 DUF4229 domain-containing protein [Hoyosella sp. YIM 151337]